MIQARLETIQAHLETIQARLEAMQARLEAMQARPEAMQARLEETLEGALLVALLATHLEEVHQVIQMKRNLTLAVPAAALVVLQYL